MFIQIRKHKIIVAIVLLTFRFFLIRFFFFFFFFFFVICLFFSTTGYNTYNNLLTLHVTIHYLYLQLNYMTIYNTLLEVCSLG